MALKVYTVHVKPADRDHPEDVVLVREGFSFWAFLFQMLWALYHRLWLVTGLFLLLALGAEILARNLGLGAGAQLVLSLAVGVLIGTEANNLRRWTLRRRGYRETAVVAGHDLDEAELHYFADFYGMGIRQ